MTIPVDVHIIDDVKIMLTLYADMMESLNYKAQLFSSPVDYLEYINSAEYLPPKLAIITDIDMPDMSGYELIDAVRKLNPSLRFVIATGSPDVPTEGDSVCFYLTKPFRVADLDKILRGVSQCNKIGALPDVIKCASLDNRQDFSIGPWRCPRKGD